MAKHKQPTGFEPGIYFNMGDVEYHNDPALSHSGINHILVSELDYWVNSCHNPAREFKEGEGMKFGKYSEMYLLEKKKFLATYNVAGGQYKPGRKVIDRATYDRVVESVKEIRSDKNSSAYFEHGYPQVSIFLRDEETGVMLRIRADYMRTFGCVDLKRMRSIQNHQLGYYCAEHGLDLQDYLYRKVIAQAKRELLAGTIKPVGDVDQVWLDAFAKDPDSMFMFFAQRSTSPFIYKIKYFAPDIRDNAKIRTEEGIRKYLSMIERFGTARPPAGDARPEEMTSYHLPKRIYDQ